MKTSKKVSTLTIFFVLFTASLIAQTLYNDVGHIPSICQQRWYNAGLMRDMSTVEPKSVIDFTSLSGSDDQKIQAALNQARNHVQSTGGLAIIYFPAGTYYFQHTIEVLPSDSNIVFQGAGSDKTDLRLTSANNAFKIYGTEDGNWIDLSQNFDKGDSVLYNSSGDFSSLQPGDWIHFAQHHFTLAGSEADEYAVGQITQVETVDPNGNWIEIKDVANRNYLYSSNSHYNIRLRKINPVRNIGIEDLTISRAYHGVASETIYNIYFLYAVNCWAKGIDSDFTQRHHLAASRSSHIEISGCYFHEAAQYSGGGYGYGVVLQVSTTNSLVENNIFKTLRHAMVAAEGSNCNVWTFNYSTDQKWQFSGKPWDDPTNRDLDLHAKYPFGHLFEHNIVEKIGSHAADGHGANGPSNAFVRNIATKHIATIGAMSDWSALGNMEDIDDVGNALRFSYEHSPAIDLYGFIQDYTVGIPHNIAYEFGYTGSCRLNDVSYYYSEKPDLLDGYTWPAIGPKTLSGGEVGWNIPAATRSGYSKKTYLPNPTPKPLTTSGTLAYDQTWSNTHTLTGDVTIPSGITLTVLPGTYVNVPAGKKITVNGTLIAQGTASRPITFNKSSSSSWYGIKFEDSSNDLESILQYCIVKNASYAVYCNNASPTIKNCEIGYSMVGIYCYGSSQSQTIQSNEIKYNSLYGLLLSHAYAPLVLDNDIHNYGTNVRCYYSGYSTTLVDA